MKICDMCGSPQVETLIFEVSKERYDLCKSCAEGIKEVLTPSPKVEIPDEDRTGRRRGRPKKTQ